MAADELFGELPEQTKQQAEAAPLEAPRLREPKRDQIELRVVDIESLIGEDHLVRVIWSYVEGLDLSELENRIKARGDRPGHPATSPRLLLALWLYATSDGVVQRRSPPGGMVLDGTIRRNASASNSGSSKNPGRRSPKPAAALSSSKARPGRMAGGRPPAFPISEARFDLVL